MDARPGFRVIPRVSNRSVAARMGETRVNAKGASCGSQNVQDVIDIANKCNNGLQAAGGVAYLCAPPGAVPGYASAPLVAAFGGAATATATITPKAPFLGARLIVFCPTAADIRLIRVTRVDVGLTRHILTPQGISAIEYDPLSANGGAFRLRAWAGPALPIEVDLTTLGATTGGVEVSFEGAYLPPAM